MTQLAQVQYRSAGPHVCTAATAMCRYPEPIVVPLVDGFGELAAVNPYVEGAQLNVGLAQFHRLQRTHIGAGIELSGLATQASP